MFGRFVERRAEEALSDTPVVLIVGPRRAEWALDFAELRVQQTSRLRQAREREAEAIADYTADRAKLIVKGTEVQVARHTRLSEAAQKLRNTIQSFDNQRRSFVALQDEVRSVRASGMSDQQWDEFLLIYKGDVDKT